MVIRRGLAHFAESSEQNVPVPVSKSMNNSSNERSMVFTSGGFSLASLALLITVVATMLASADADLWQKQYAWLSVQSPLMPLAWFWIFVTVRPALLLFGGAVILGALVGLVHWFLDDFRWRTLLIAPLSGALAGCIGMLILVAPGPFWRSLACIVVLLMTTNLLRIGAE